MAKKFYLRNDKNLCFKAKRVWGYILFDIGAIPEKY